MCSPAPPRTLVDDLIHEILLRLPPDDPACLARASLACTSWRRILTDPGFLRRYREHHRMPPMLGFLRYTVNSPRNVRPALFVPTSSFRPAAAPDRRGALHAMAARHGRVLLRTDPYAGPVSLVVWDPVTGQQRSLPRVPLTAPSQVTFNAVVLCAATDAGCDHLDCHGGPFAVAYVGVGMWKRERCTFACLYSSEAGEWGKPARSEKNLAVVDNRPGVIVGNAVYFICAHRGTRRIVGSNMGTMELSVSDPPSSIQPGTVLTPTEDGKLGFAGVHERSLYLWAREAGPSDGASAAWTLRRVIDLHTMLLYFSLGNVPVWHVPSLIGFADGGTDGVVFVMAEAGRVFSVELDSGRFWKTSFARFHNGEPGQEPVLIPYMCFCTPDRAKDLHRREEA